MSFSVEGDYFEACTCDVSCPCIWLKPADRDTCDVMLAWHVTSGQKDGVDLSGLNAVMAVHTPKQMTDGGWKVALYLDDRATPDQSEALGAVFSGGAGGHLAALAPLIGEVAGVAPASIIVRSDERIAPRGGRRGPVDGSRGAEGDGRCHAARHHEPAARGPSPSRQRKRRPATSATTATGMSSTPGTNSFVTDFAYEG